MRHDDDRATRAANRAYVRLAMSRELLAPGEEQELATKWREHGCVRSLHALIEAHGSW